MTRHTLLLAATFAFLALPGCGPNALLFQADTATLAARTLAEAQPVAQAARAQELDACAALDDLPCLERVTVAWAPVVVGFQLGHDALIDWTAALALARAFGSELDTGAALISAFTLAVTTWRAIGTALATHGLSLPTVPLLSPEPQP